jgi:hypothetical protein
MTLDTFSEQIRTQFLQRISTAGIGFLVLFTPNGLYAQCEGFSNGKNLHQLQRALVPGRKSRVGERKVLSLVPETSAPIKKPLAASILFLPKWSADQLPFFCRIEHQWAQQHRIPLKFRLGSVEYVDWLEGK